MRPSDPVISEGLSLGHCPGPILCLRVVWSITLFTSPGRGKAMTQAMYLVIGAIVIIVVFFVIVTLL